MLPLELSSAILQAAFCERSCSFERAHDSLVQDGLALDFLTDGVYLWDAG